MKGSILFNKDINIEVDVDPSAEEGARLVSAKNLVDGQEAGGGGGGDFSTANVTITNSAGYQANVGIGYIDENGILQPWVTMNDGDVITIKTPVAENGAYYEMFLAEANVTGGVQFIQDAGAVLITGDGTLEVLSID